ncbi:MAG TPA: hypothetical protein PLZ69_01775 [Candidatus Pacearchaeota archaeon]|nr:hypothetical protein [Candidatus Pacearchaeota archaeon]
MENKKIVIFIILALIVVSIIFVAFFNKNDSESPLIQETENVGDIIVPPITDYEGDENWSEAITKIKDIDSDKEVYFTESCKAEPLSNLSGTIYLSLVPQNSDKMGIYGIDVDTGAISDFLVDDSKSYYGINFSNDGSMISFVSKDENGSSVMIASANGKNIRRVTKESSDHIINPQIYDNNSKVLFSRSEYPAPNIPESSKIYSSDLNGNEVFLTEGNNPLLSPDEKKMLFMKVAGIYLFDMETLEQKRVIELRDAEGEIIFNKLMSKARISQDKSKLIVSYAGPGENSLYSFEIISWSPFQYRLKAVINQPSFFWEAFSPDSNYVAVQAGDIVFSDKFLDGKKVSYFESQNTRLAIFDTCNFDEVKSFDLEKKFNLIDMFVDFWR